MNDEISRLMLQMLDSLEKKKQLAKEQEALRDQYGVTQALKDFEELEERYKKQVDFLRKGLGDVLEDVLNAVTRACEMVNIAPESVADVGARYVFSMLRYMVASLEDGFKTAFGSNVENHQGKE